MTRKQRGPLVVGRQACVSGYITHLMADSLLSTDTAEQDSLSSQATEYKLREGKGNHIHLYCELQKKVILIITNSIKIH